MRSVGVFLLFFCLLSSASAQQPAAQLYGPLLSPVIEGVIYADQKCTTPGTYDDSCLSNILSAASSHLNIVLPGNADGTLRTYIFAHGVHITNVLDVKITCAPNVLIRANSGFPDLFFFIIEGASQNTYLDGSDRGCQMDGTNLPPS
jgi:hypothetical protein